VKKSTILLALVCFWPAIAFAAVYKCPNERGNIVFSDKPCENALRKDGSKWTDVEQEKKEITEKNRKLAEEKRKREIEDAAKRQEQYQIQQRNAALAEQRRRENEAAAEQERANQIARAKASGLYVIEYSVEGSTSSASLTFTNQSGGTEQHKVDLPWRQSMTVQKGFFAYISAQNQKSYGALSVKILLNGIPVKSSDSSGEYGIASASGKV